MRNAYCMDRRPVSDLRAAFSGNYHGILAVDSDLRTRYSEYMNSSFLSGMAKANFMP